MPEITRFYGMVIKMFFNDHNPPHFHAIYGEYIASIDIKTLEVIEGDLPRKALSLVLDWATTYQESLLEMWNTKKINTLPPLL
jgi:hypothetical protein